MSSYGEDLLGSQSSRNEHSAASITTSGTSDTALTAPSISLDSSSQNVNRSFLELRATQGNRIASLEESTKSLAVLQSLELGCNQEEREHWRSHRDAFCTAFTKLSTSCPDTVGRRCQTARTGILAYHQHPGG
jgi:hypothetical protein